MSSQRRSTSPLSSASPSPPRTPVAEGVTPVPNLSLGSAPENLDEEEEEEDEEEEEAQAGSSSTTTLTEPLTDSELTEDDDEIVRPGDPVKIEDVEEDDDDDGDDYGDDDGDDIGVGDGERDGTDPQDSRRRILNGIPSLSPSLTPPPPSDPIPPLDLPPSPLPKREDSVNGDEDDEMSELDDEGVDGVDGDDGDGDGEEDDVDGDGDRTMRADQGEEEEVSDKTVGEQGEELVNDDEEAGGEDEEDREGDGGGDAEEEDGEVEASESPATIPMRASNYIHSSHAPLPTAGAMRSLLALEIKFAALRDRLYVERLEETAREEEMILNGTHPALLYLNKTLQTRRERLHEIASRRHQETIAELVRTREADKNLTWSWWTDERDRMHWEEFAHTWSKRRRLAREKNEIETPKNVKPVPRVEKPPRPFEWSSGAVPSRLSTEDALHDLALMDIRRQPQPISRHASPAVYGNFTATSYSHQAPQHSGGYLPVEGGEASGRHYTNASRPRPPNTMPSQTHIPGSNNTSAQQAPQRKDPRPLGSEVFGVQRKEAQHNQPNGMTNGHARHLLGQPVLGLSLNPGSTTYAPSAAVPTERPTAANVVAQSTSALASQPQPERPNASSRFPGLADYLSGSSATASPQSSFQHHLSSTAAAQGKPSSAPSTRPTTTPSSASPSIALMGSSLGRTPFPQVTQQTASVPRS